MIPGLTRTEYASVRGNDLAPNMKTNVKVFLGAMVLLVLGGCALSQGTPAPSAKAAESSQSSVELISAEANRPAVSNFPVIGYLEKRGQTITIKAGPIGPVYSVQTAEGRVLFEDVTAEQLRAQAPELHEFLKTAVTGGPAKPVLVDASLHPVR